VIIFIDHTGDQPGERMSKCLNRSPLKIHGKVSTCCGGSKDIEAYKCNARNIFPLTNEICLNCSKFRES